MSLLLKAWLLFFLSLSENVKFLIKINIKCSGRRGGGDFPAVDRHRGYLSCYPPLYATYDIKSWQRENVQLVQHFLSYRKLIFDKTLWTHFNAVGSTCELTCDPGFHHFSRKVRYDCVTQKVRPKNTDFIREASSLVALLIILTIDIKY